MITSDWVAAEGWLREVGEGRRKPFNQTWGICSNMTCLVGYIGFSLCDEVFTKIGYDPIDPMAQRGFPYHLSEEKWKGEEGESRRDLCLEMANWIRRHKL